MAPIKTKSVFRFKEQKIGAKNFSVSVVVKDQEYSDTDGKWKVQKILRKEYKLPRDFKTNWHKREGLIQEYVESLEKLPLFYSEENAAVFNEFFESFGHGIVCVAYEGGERRFREDGEEVRGGNAKLEGADWEKSVHNQCRNVAVILNYEEDVCFHHQFVEGLKWLPSRRARAEALEEAIGTGVQGDSVSAEEK